MERSRLAGIVDGFCFLMRETSHLQKCNPHNTPRRSLLLTPLDREESRGSGRLRDLQRS